MTPLASRRYVRLKSLDARFAAEARQSLSTPGLFGRERDYLVEKFLVEMNDPLHCYALRVLSESKVFRHKTKVT